jgi:hypothetical protein
LAAPQIQTTAAAETSASLQEAVKLRKQDYFHPVVEF